MTVPRRRGFNRLFVVFCVLWAVNALVIRPKRQVDAWNDAVMQMALDAMEACEKGAKDCKEAVEFVNEQRARDPFKDYFTDLNVVASLLGVPVAVYALGIAVAWVIRGFKPAT